MASPRICAELDGAVAGFRERRLDRSDFPYVFVDATYVKAHDGARVVSKAIVVATGVASDGNREVLGLAVGDSEDKAFWTAFLLSLRARGLAGVRPVISDAHEGLRSSIEKVMLGAACQRCRVHFMMTSWPGCTATILVSVSTTGSTRQPYSAAEGLDHAWLWFALHANQRMQVLNYFLVAIAFLTAAYVSTLQAEVYGLAIAVAIVGFLITTLFAYLDRRTRELVKAGEAALRVLQDRLASDLQLDSMRILDIVEVPAQGTFSYTVLLGYVHLTVQVGYLGAAIAAGVAWGVR